MKPAPPSWIVALRSREALRLTAASVVVAATVAMFVVPHVQARWHLSPDAIEHLSIARQWVDGSGFVNGVRSYFFLEHKLPIPGIAVRAPGISVLLAIPMALGATLDGVLLFHALVASAMAGLGVLVARRVAPFGAAVAGAFAIALSPAWLNLSRYAWSEALSFGFFVSVVMSARGILRSHRGAIACGLVCVLAWLTRPLFYAMPLALGVAVLLDLGLRPGIRHRPLWSFFATFFVAQLVVKQIALATTGLSPYQGYGMVTQIFGSGDLFFYQREFAGTAAFLRSEGARVWEVVSARPAQLGSTLFLEGTYHWVGWLGLPAVIYCLLRRGRGGLERKALALASLGYSLVVVLNYSAYDPKRYPLIVAAAGWFCTVAMLGDVAERLAQRWAVGSALARLTAWAPAILIGGLVATTMLDDTLPARRQAVLSSDGQGVKRAYRARDKILPRFCPDMEAAAPVAVSRNLMWDMHLWCGNPGVNLPFDLWTEKWQRRFIDEEGIHYIVAREEKKHFRWLVNSPLVERVRRLESYTLYRVRETSAPENTWTPAPPLVCLGQAADCARSATK